MPAVALFEQEYVLEHRDNCACFEVPETYFSLPCARLKGSGEAHFHKLTVFFKDIVKGNCLFDLVFVESDQSPSRRVQEQRLTVQLLRSR